MIWRITSRAKSNSTPGAQSYAMTAAQKQDKQKQEREK
jgi:hypothetical protein